MGPESIQVLLNLFEITVSRLDDFRFALCLRAPGRNPHVVHEVGDFAGRDDLSVALPDLLHRGAGLGVGVKGLHLVINEFVGNLDEGLRKEIHLLPVTLDQLVVRVGVLDELLVFEGPGFRLFRGALELLQAGIFFGQFLRRLQLRLYLGQILEPRSVIGVLAGEAEPADFVHRQHGGPLHPVGQPHGGNFFTGEHRRLQGGGGHLPDRETTQKQGEQNNQAETDREFEGEFEIFHSTLQLMTARASTAGVVMRRPHRIASRVTSTMPRMKRLAPADTGFNFIKLKTTGRGEFMDGLDRSPRAGATIRGFKSAPPLGS